jgi:hypothetical protein
MGLKCSPYHLNKFLEKAFSHETYAVAKNQLSKAEKQLISPKFSEMLILYFDDFFVFADTYEQLLAYFKIILIASRMAKIKFSIE